MTDYLLTHSGPSSGKLDTTNHVDQEVWLTMPDNMMNDYSGNEIRFDNTAMAAHSSEFFDAKSSYITGGWVQSIETTVAMKPSADVSMLTAIQANSAGIINECAIKVGGQQVIGLKTMGLVPLYVDLCSSMTPTGEALRDMQLFAMDNNMSIKYEAAVDNKVGLHNASTTEVLRDTATGQTGVGKKISCNHGLVKKLDMVTSADDPFVTEAGLTASVRALVKRISNNQVVVYYKLYMPLTSIHDVFNRWPLCKSTEVALTVRINQSTTGFTVTDGKITHVTCTNGSSGVNSQMLNLDAIKNMTTTAAANIVTCKSHVMAKGTIRMNPLANGWKFVARLVTMSDKITQALLQQHKRLISYENSSYRLLQDIHSNSNYSTTLTSSVSRPTRIMLAFEQSAELGFTDSITDTVFTDANAIQSAAISNCASCFNCAPYQTIPGSSSITNLQIEVAGDPVFRRGEISDTRELYEMFLRAQSVDGGFDPVTATGISYEAFLKGFGFIIIDLTKENASLNAKWIENKGITLRFRSNHRSKLQCHSWVLFEDDFTLDISTGKLIN